MKLRNSDAQFRLDNNTQTIVKINRRLNMDVEPFFRELKRRGVPFSYFDNLEYINFSFIDKHTNGWYEFDKITIDVRSYDKDVIVSTMIHELAHHVDDYENLNSGLYKERRTLGHHLNSLQTWQNNNEYVAIGFEKFYESKSERKLLKKNNPKLYHKILKTHNKFLNM